MATAYAEVDAEAAAFVLRSMNILPAWLQRRCARAVYSGQLLGVIVSRFPRSAAQMPAVRHRW